ncbi:hypothetical protein Aau02nite_07730 [Amorphoplanes auranticolor]|uniref:Uncharacterized protein n=1 Tax=Actinoplanes auranticolor TaxID=47988 RepID=A0A919VPH6_9ACTN|nr:hypothetical protein Aau02nite_07730 [Actinoplanes auranticolor]
MADRKRELTTAGLATLRRALSNEEPGTSGFSIQPPAGDVTDRIRQGGWGACRAAGYSWPRGFRSLSTPWALLGRGVGSNGAVVPLNSSVGGQGHEAFTGTAHAPLVLRALSHVASWGPLHVSVSS